MKFGPSQTNSGIPRSRVFKVCEKPFPKKYARPVTSLLQINLFLDVKLSFRKVVNLDILFYLPHLFKQKYKYYKN